MLTFPDILSECKTVAVTGSPKSGKTTLCTEKVTDRPVIHTDDFMDYDWSDVPEAVMEACGRAGARFVVEGVQVPRALRKGLTVDAVVFIVGVRERLSNGQRSMAKGLIKVLREWQLVRHDVPLYAQYPDGRLQAVRLVTREAV